MESLKITANHYGIRHQNEEINGQVTCTEIGQSGISITSTDEGNDRALLMKVDIVLLPILCLLYACALIDRINISAARVDGMGKELGLLDPKQNYYSLTLLVFFPAYL